MQVSIQLKAQDSPKLGMWDDFDTEDSHSVNSVKESKLAQNVLVYNKGKARLSSYTLCEKQKDDDKISIPYKKILFISERDLVEYIFKDSEDWEQQKEEWEETFPQPENNNKVQNSLRIKEFRHDKRIPSIKILARLL